VTGRAVFLQFSQQRQTLKVRYGNQNTLKMKSVLKTMNNIRDGTGSNGTESGLLRAGVFTGRQHSLLCKPCTSHRQDVCPSLCLSVCPWHAGTEWKRSKLDIKSSPTDSPVSGEKIHPEIRKGSPRTRALSESGVGKIRNSQPIRRRVSETVQDRTKVTIND